MYIPTLTSAPAIPPVSEFIHGVLHVVHIILLLGDDIVAVVVEMSRQDQQMPLGV